MHKLPEQRWQKKWSI